jgi:hypothetical protein
MPIRCRALFPVCLAMSLGCASTREQAPEPDRTAAQADAEALVYLRAEADRAIFLEREVERLRRDLEAAEEVLVAVESGLASSYTRATAVSALAEARISLQRAEAELPYLPDVVTQARGKLEQADSQLAEGHLGAAICFATRAQGIAQGALDDASGASRNPDAYFVSGARVNLREGPSLEHGVVSIVHRGLPVFPVREEGEWLLVRTVRGRVGWVHASLLARP